MSKTTSLGGRPPIGDPINIRLEPDDLRAVDAAAETQRISRAAWIRQAVAEHLFIERDELAGFVGWLLDDQGVDHSEVVRVIEKIHNYEDWLLLYRAGQDIPD